MYSTCLFCHSDLGHNEAIEHFPVGRRLVFDAAKGRLWVVCRRCARWNLTPLEERWEAIEEAERCFRRTKLRMSTEHIGLAKLPEGLELVRVGRPIRPEMAAWRYGDQFGRRRKRYIARVAVGTGVVGVVVAFGPAAGLASGISASLINTLNLGNLLYRFRRRIALPTAAGIVLVPLQGVRSATISSQGAEISLEIPTSRPLHWGTLLPLAGYPASTVLHGEDAVRATSALLPHVSRVGGSAGQVREAVTQLENAVDTRELFRNAERATPWRWNDALGLETYGALARIPAPFRLALEMSLHEESERRALEGELHVLEAAWKEAEEIAAIADDLVLPDSVKAALARLSQRSGQPHE